MSKLRSGLTYANVMATIAVFLALGGGAYAAFKLPNNSVGSKQIKDNAVKSAKVANGSLLANDFRAGELPAGPAGEQGPQGLPGTQGLKGDSGQQGLKGDPCLASDLNCKGPKGDTGAQGPGALSFDGQFPVDGDHHQIAVVNGLDIDIVCDSRVGRVGLTVQKRGNTSFYAWGTVLLDAATTYSPAPVDVASGQPYEVYQLATNRLELDLVAHATASGEAVKWTRVSLLGVRGNFCNYHALIIPPS
jgi:hypothetical protein